MDCSSFLQLLPSIIEMHSYTISETEPSESSLRELAIKNKLTKQMHLYPKKHHNRSHCCHTCFYKSNKY